MLKKKIEMIIAVTVRAEFWIQSLSSLCPATSGSKQKLIIFLEYNAHARDTLWAGVYYIMKGV